MKVRKVGRVDPTEKQRSELRALTGLRGVAATTVALAHFRLLLPYDLHLLFFWQNAAVDLFFCLSGFTLSYVYSAGKFRFSDYLIARVARIYPLYLATLIIGVAYVWVFLVDPLTYPPGMALSDLQRQLLMLNAWPVIGSGVHWNFPAWSISVEWFCYVLLFPLLLRVVPARTGSARLLTVVVLSAVSFSMFMAYFDERITSAAIYSAKSQWSYWVNLLRGILGFTVGWVVYTSFESGDELHTVSTRWSSMIWLCAAAILVLSYLGRSNSHALVLLFPFMVLTATDSASVTSRLLASRPLHFLGVISYSVYMMHFFVYLVFVGMFSAPDGWTMPIYALLVATTIAVSTATYVAIEMPARNVIRRLRVIR